jgi:hypothetical protein
LCLILISRPDPYRFVIHDPSHHYSRDKSGPQICLSTSSFLSNDP